MALKEKGDHKAAIECYDMAIQIDPKYKIAYSSKGISLEGIGDHKSAIECYDVAI